MEKLQVVVRKKKKRVGVTFFLRKREGAFGEGLDR